MTNNIDKIFEIFLYPFIFLSLYFQVFMLYNFLSNKKKMSEEEEVSVDFFPTVTFLLPGWNESKNILVTIKSIQDLNYPKDKIKIFYIDNNSTDNTKEILKELIENRKTDDQIDIKYYFEDKQGKHHAMNLGLKHVTSELVVCLDVDSTLCKESMSVAAQYFKDTNIKAVASCMQLRNVRTIWQRIQVVEYMLSVFWRKSYSSIDAVQVMPGPFSVFRKSVFDELGHYKSAHNAEDFEMTLRLHKNHYKIANAHKAYVYTVGPDTLRGFLKQRVRWIRGFLENAWDYREMFFKKKYGHFGMFTLPVGAAFVFYVLYVAAFTIIKSSQIWYVKIENYLALGVHIPNFKAINIDPFYITTDILLVQSIFIFTMLSVVLLVSKNIASSKDPLLINFFIYIFVYPFIGSIFLVIAVYKFLFRKENSWVLQDNKNIR